MDDFSDLFPYVMNDESDHDESLVKGVWLTLPDNLEVAAVEFFITCEQKARYDEMGLNKHYYYPNRHD